MPNRIDYKPGDKLGVLTYVSEAPYRTTGKQPKRMVLVECPECGDHFEASPTEARIGRTQRCPSCNTIHRQNRLHGNSLARTHGNSTHELYGTWRDMKARCYHTTAHNYQYYGGRGITVCKRWLESFPAFVEDMGPKPDPTYTLDRIDNAGPYAPWNTKWASRAEQAKNRRPREVMKRDWSQFQLELPLGDYESTQGSATTTLTVEED